MKKYYFTFGCHPEKVQVIYAHTPGEAKSKMIQLYEKDWAFQYTEEEWQSTLAEGFFKKAEYLPVVYCGDHITTGEMMAWTERFVEIMESNERVRDQRLASLMTDLEQCYKIPCINDEGYNKANPYIVQLYRTVSEARFL